MLLEHPTLDKLVKFNLTRVSSRKLGSYTQYLTSSRHISLTVARTNTKKYQIVANFVSLPFLEFGLYAL